MGYAPYSIARSNVINVYPGLNLTVGQWGLPGDSEKTSVGGNCHPATTVKTW
jgi:hypothetical protein